MANHPPVRTGGDTSFFLSTFNSPPSTYFDEFLTLSNISGGTYGAGSGNSLTLTSSQDANHPGQALLTSGTGGSGTGEGASLAGASFSVTNLDTAPAWKMATDVKLSTLTNARFLWGAPNNFNAAPTVGYYIYYDSSVGANWQVVTAAGATTTQDSGIAASASAFVPLRIESDGTTVSFYINGTLAKTSTTNFTNSALRLSWQAVALSASSITLAVDYFSWWRNVSR